MMKVLTMLAAAGLMGTGALAPVTASAQHHRTEMHSRTVTYHNGGARYGTRRVCKVERHHHRKVRVCRTVRYRR